MEKLKVFISGQKFFAESVLALCLAKGVKVVGVCCPLEDKYIRRLAVINEIPIINSGNLNADTMPRDVDLGITAHSFDYIGKKTRYIPKHGWIGYHPSLLPRHRGRSSIEWAVRMRDAITGGSVYWLNSGIDRGDVAYRDWCFIDPALYSMPCGEAAKKLWRDDLFDIGIRLLSRAVCDISSGKVIREPQDARFSTFEPSTDIKDVYKPDLLMLNEINSSDRGW